MMNLRTRLILRFIKRHPWHSALSVIGIALGIAVVLAIDITNESARQAFRLSNAAVSSGSTHYIYGGPQNIDESLYVDLRIGHRIRNISPVVSGYASLKQQRFILLGIDPLAHLGSHAFPQPRGDTNFVQLLQRGNAAFMLESTARRLGISTPAEVTIQISGAFHPLHIVSTLQPTNELQQYGLRNVLITDIATAQSILGMVGKLSRIDVNTADPMRIGKRLPKPLSIVPNEMRSQTMEHMTRAFHLNLTALSLLALVIGAFLIYNTMTLAVLQRREYFAVLRTLGMTPRQLFSDIIREALVLAAIGFVLGSLLGIWLSRVLLHLISGTIADLYFAIDVQAVSVPILSVTKAAALAFIATLIAAWHPAWEAMRTQPMVNALRSNVETDARRRSIYFMMLGVSLWGVAGIILVLSERNIIAGFTALFFVIIGFALLTPLLLLGLLKLLNPVLNRYFGVLGRMAGRGVRASLSRTQIAVAALAIAVSAVVGVSVMISSFRVSVEHWLNNFLRADIYIAQQQAHRATGIDPKLISDIATMPQVKTVSTGRWTTLENRTGFTQVFAVDLDRPGFKNFQLKSGDNDALWSEFAKHNVVIISEPYAYHHGLEIGDLLDLPTDRGKVAFKIVGVFYDYGSDQGVVTMHRTTYNRHWNDRVVSSFSLYLRDGVDIESFVHRLNSNQLMQQSLRIRSNRTLREKSLQIFDRTFVITDVLRLLAICIAIVGILSALMAIQLERAKEFAVLRATGLSPKQLWGLVTTESGLMGLVAGVIACPLGLVMAWVLIFIINRRSFGWSMQFHFDLEPWLTALVLSIVAALIAGLYPASRMAKSLPALALRYE